MIERMRVLGASTSEILELEQKCLEFKEKVMLIISKDGMRD